MIQKNNCFRKPIFSIKKNQPSPGCVPTMEMELGKKKGGRGNWKAEKGRKKTENFRGNQESHSRGGGLTKKTRARKSSKTKRLISALH